MKKGSILLLDAGGTQTLPVAEYFYRNNYHVIFFLFSKYTYGSGSRYSHNKIFAPNSINDDAYLAFLIKFISSNNIDLIIPLSDITAEHVSRYQEKIMEYSKIITPAISNFSTGYNKGLLMHLCEENSFPHPKTYHVNTFSDIDNVDDKLFPLFLKPNITTGGRGMSVINCKSELRKKADVVFKDYGSFHLQEFIPPGGKQYKVQLFRGKNGEIVASSVMHKQRYYPVKGGSSCFNITIARDDLVLLCTKVLNKLNWVGFADFDLIEDPRNKVEKILEINPRLPACIKSAFKSGINYAEIYMNESNNNAHNVYSYKTGIGLRHLGLDILWFLNAEKKSWDETLEWFNFFSKDQYFQDLSIWDLKSFFYGLYGNLKS